MEIWDLYDSDRKTLGKTHVRGVPLQSGTFHLVVHIFIRNDKGELLVSKRHPDKPYGLLWECAGGSVTAGESSLEGALREVEEELGIIGDPERMKLLHQATRETHHVDYWLLHSNAGIEQLKLQPEEVVDAKWVDKAAYDEMIRKGQVVPTLAYFYDLVLE